MKRYRWLWLSIRSHLSRKIVGIAAVAIAAALLTWMIGLTTNNMAQHKTYIKHMTDGYDMWLTAKVETIGPRQGRGAGFQAAEVKDPKPVGVSPKALDILKSHEEITEVLPLKLQMVRFDYKQVYGPGLGGTLTTVIPNNGKFCNDLLEGSWPDNDSEEPQIVMSAGGFFAQNAPQIGETINVIGRGFKIKAKVVGLLRQARSVRGFPSVFGNPACMNSFTGTENPLYSLVLLKVKDGTKLAELRSKLGDAFEDRRIEASIDDTELQLKQLKDQELLSILNTKLLSICLAIALMFCMIYITLYTMVAQRTTIYQRLRAIGMSRKQLVATIVSESLVMGFFGAISGIILGYAVLKVFTVVNEDIYPEGLHLHPPTIFGVFLAVLFSALIASILPSIKVQKLKPADTTARINRRPGRLPIARIIIGVALMLPALAMSFPFEITPEIRCGILLYAGLPLLIVGAVVSAPLWILVMEDFGVPVVAKIFKLDPRLLKKQISRDLGRTVGIMMTIAVGLGLFAAIEIWGASMLKPFIPDPVYPTIVTSCTPGGFSQDVINKAKNIPGIREDQFMELKVAQCVLDEKTMEKLEANVKNDVWQNNVLILGVDPEQAFGGASPMLPFEMMQGNIADAKEAILAGEGCIIPATLARHADLNVNDTVSFLVPKGGYPALRRRGGGGGGGFGRGGGEENQGPSLEKGVNTVTFRIAGIAETNWHMVTSRSGMRGINGQPHRTLGPIFVSHQMMIDHLYQQNVSTSFVWYNLTDEYRQRPYKEVTDELKAAFEEVAQNPRARIQVIHADFIYEGTIQHAMNIIGAMTRVPFWSLAIFALGMINLLVAIVVERRKELGMLRAIGMTRSQFIRLLSGEVVLVWGASVLISLAGGLAAGWAFTGWTKAKIAFGGLPISFEVPWTGLGLAILFSITSIVVVSAIPIHMLTSGKPCEMLRQD